MFPDLAAVASIPTHHKQPIHALETGHIFISGAVYSESNFAVTRISYHSILDPT